MRLNTTTKTAKRKPRGRLLIPLSYFCCLCLIFSYSRCCLMANAEFYSSVDSLKILGNTEATLIQNYRQYLKLQKRNIDIVQRFIKDVKLNHELAKEDVADYIGNPINAFTLIKRMVSVWKELYEFLQFHDIKTEFIESFTQFKRNFQLPDEGELKGAIRGLKRLQSFYKLSADDMANGDKYGQPLKWRDCFEIGATLLDDNSFKLAIEWLELSLRRLHDSKESIDIKTTFNAHIKEYLAFAYQSIAKFDIAREHLDDILENDPNASVKITRNVLKNFATVIKQEEEVSYPNYARLCRGEILRKLQPLSCKIDSKLHPFFILSPLQIEPLLLKPEITMYHNLLNDKQISKLLKETHNKMQRSQVFGGIALEGLVSQKTAISPKSSVIVNKLHKIVGAITGFDMDNSEDLQVANYGIGGQYKPHMDYFACDHKTKYQGDRIATNMFYLADVEEGGYTVFPSLDVYVKPIKGSMIMWYNLHKSLDVDPRTIHAGCPVLKGSKKIANIWIHSGYQEFRRPCGLENDSKLQEIKHF